MRIVIILLLSCYISIGCSSVRSAINSMSGINSSNSGIGSSLSSNNSTFGSGIDILDDSDANQKFSDLNTHFNNATYLTGKASNIQQPTSLAYSYFEIVDTFQRSVTSTNVNSKDESGKTPLVMAIEKNDITMVRFLISKNAKVDTAALNAAQSSENSLIQQLIQQR